jgi:hypothetical protein
LLLDLVGASLSRRVQNLAGSTASATADAIANLGATLARMARQGAGLPAGGQPSISPAIGGQAASREARSAAGLAYRPGGAPSFGVRR